MSVALIPMASELGWSTAERGFVSSAFFWGYAATQIPAGYIATRVGGSKVLLFGVALWSLGMPSAFAVCLCENITHLSEVFNGDVALVGVRQGTPETLQLL
jgi:MFS transporter, ACS family, solute carrier family 17 (sodium-dependent inorganic phosphate cotransporter), other